MEPVYSTVIGAGQLLFRGLGLRITLDGDENVPTTGPVVLASNHVSFLDFALVGLAARRSRRYVRFLTRYDVWHAPIAGRLMNRMRHIPVDRAAPAAAYLTARAMLRGGEAVGVFPEAGVSTSFTVRSLMPGAVALAAESGAPLLPMVIWGPQRIYTADLPRDLTRGRPVSLLLGSPMYVGRHADVVAETRRLGRTLQGMLDDVQARAQHQPDPGEHAPWHPAHLGGHAPTPEQARLVETVPRSSVPPSWLASP
ncbi:MAG: lysophospholipid acyltransferase family protein [Pseudonocardia sp.]